LAGDEFVVVLTNTDGRSASMAARRITLQLAECDTGELRLHIPIRVSIGISTYGEPATDVDGLIHAADTSMYREKRLTKTEHPAVTAAEGWDQPAAP
jgi:diguanylate cyclase (GGDEF)-like protein